MTNALLECPLQVAFRRDASLQALTNRPRPDAALGAATHLLAEAASRGQFDDVPPAGLSVELAAYWDGQVDGECSRFNQMDLLGPMPPPKRWPYYSVKRTRALRYSERIVRARRTSEWGRLAAPGVRTEVSLTSDDPPLIGRIDRIERGPGGICLVDLKTGTSPPEEGDLDTEHRTQLLLYAALYRSATREVPHALAIQYLDGIRKTVEIDWAEVHALVSQVLNLRDEFNRSLSERTPAKWEKVARPDDSVCLRCDFEPVCGPFLARVAPTQPAFAACAVGTVEGLAPFGQLTSVRLSVEAGIAEAVAAKEISILGVPANLAPEMGSRISVCWATKAASGADLRVTWQSRVYTWPSS